MGFVLLDVMVFLRVDHVSEDVFDLDELGDEPRVLLVAFASVAKPLRHLLPRPDRIRQIPVPRYVVEGFLRLRNDIGKWNELRDWELVATTLTLAMELCLGLWLGLRLGLPFAFGSVVGVFVLGLSLYATRYSSVGQPLCEVPGVCFAPPIGIGELVEPIGVHAACRVEKGVDVAGRVDGLYVPDTDA